jgi:hypothetical protein
VFDGAAGGGVTTIRQAGDTQVATYHGTISFA